ncbi:hypothetical protein K461DRAFT_312497 [Myriangium duriaei CBS 260.36]|uniref:Response regulatory domain-containing protein n=1 Tax=Myriangium duriaei CBS 260.36 TaxID=1168546 RepID=A0A9P4MHB5_9PEZI|nr:hypothetical protein K461DRAFT_312497 [Myriangium duriaei CBS 260.36]
MDLGSNLKRILTGQRRRRSKKKDERQVAGAKGSAVADGSSGGSNRSNSCASRPKSQKGPSSLTSCPDHDHDHDNPNPHQRLNSPSTTSLSPLHSTTSTSSTADNSVAFAKPTPSSDSSSPIDKRETSSTTIEPPSLSHRTSHPSIADSEPPALHLQQATPPVQDGLSSVAPPSSAVIDAAGTYTFACQLTPAHPPLRDQAPIIDILPLESAAISEYSLPPLAIPPQTSSGSGLDVPVLQERLQAEVQYPQPPSYATTASSLSVPQAAPGPPPNTTALVPNTVVPMPQPRKIWVKRPGASATLVAIRDDDLVDDVRDKILQKYANSLGRSFDSPDVMLRILSRTEGAKQIPPDRLLGPEEEIGKVLDTYYPNGQTVSDALVIDIPPKRTPRPSPRHHHTQSNSSYQALEDYRPQESGTDYFPPMPPAVAHAINGQVATSHDPRALSGVLRLPEHTRALSVLGTGQVPPLPSPGAATRRQRPKYGRQHTSSPTIIGHAPAAAATVVVSSPGPSQTQHLQLRANQRPRHDSNASERPTGAPAPPPLPTPPAPEAPPTGRGSPPPTPIPRDPHRGTKPRKSRKPTPTNGATTKSANPTLQTSSLLDGSVPPINVLIVEDNIINLKLLEAFMKRLKVRWSTAMNGQIAVNKWRTGGFHLVLMDIQLPIMSGLDATKEIRRLERVNGIGVFSSSTPPTPLPRTGSSDETVTSPSPTKTDSAETKDSSLDKLNMEEGLFKSPVIIVALTASSLQSDRHEALAAGCNDFLTKPVNFVWMERKVKEWGCMQALIDFDGWRKWKDFSATNDAKAGVKSPVLDGVSKADLATKAREKRAKRDKRVSTDINGGQGGMLSAGPSSGTASRRISTENGNEAADEAGS